MENNLKRVCFSILVKDNDEEIIDRGTGFFINDKGNFLSVGHVFKHKNCTFSAIIDGEPSEYIITEIYNEYIPQDEITSVTYKDLYVGKISMSPEAHLALMIETVSASSQVTMAGFNKIPNEGLIMSQEDLFNEDLMNENSVFFNTYETKINDQKHHKTNRTTGEYYFMDNIYSVDSVGARVRGISGGPLVIDSACIGIVNNPVECVNSKYITDKLVSLGIPFTPCRKV